MCTQHSRQYLHIAQCIHGAYMQYVHVWYRHGVCTHSQCAGWAASGSGRSFGTSNHQHCGFTSFYIELKMVQMNLFAKQK